MLKLAPPFTNNVFSGETVINQIVSGFNLQGWIEMIDADYPIEVDGIEFTPNLSTVSSYDWNVEVYE